MCYKVILGLFTLEVYVISKPVQVVPLHPAAQVQTLGAVQDPPFLQAEAHTGTETQ